ncbi:MAG TPA: HAMP domain-containing sensor histidine kinase [Pirellulales bacterium]|jgi:signal transduction histidine kinase|nr:HAMP domain-containing sensor histidine kinase [Pirellulales bacterium]
MRWPLRYQILIPFALVLLGVVCVVSVLNAVLATARAKSQIEDQLQGVAATLADSSFPLTDMVLRQMHGLSGADFVFVDPAGQVLAESKHFELPAGQSTNVADHSQQLRLGPPVDIAGQQYFQMLLAVPGRGLQQSGQLHIYYPVRFWHEARSEAALPPLMVGAVALIATALLALLIAGRLTRPILELRSQVSRLAQAVYSPISLPSRNDELRDLAEDVNRLAEQLAEMERAIRRSERLSLLGQLAGGLAHQLRNNVTGARMAVQLHARECTSDPESLSVALRQLALTEENLKQFLAAPQSPHLMPATKRIPCQLPDVIHEVVELLDPSLQHRHVHLSVVERATSNGQLQANTAQLRQMLMNLVLNAADAAGPGGWVRIETCANDFEPPGVILRVIDNGNGPPQEMLTRLFEPFATSKPEGVGLGLAVAQQIAQSHEGRIAFHRVSEETCFEVHLPLVQNPMLDDTPLSRQIGAAYSQPENSQI